MLPNVDSDGEVEKVNDELLPDESRINCETEDSNVSPYPDRKKI
jgi:hypothetical protein